MNRNKGLAFFWVLIIGMFLLAGCAGGAAVGSAGPSGQGSGASQPAETDLVYQGMYYHLNTPVDRGWNGVPWTAPVDQFREIHPDAVQIPDTVSAWRTGRGEEEFFGFKLPAVYYFDTEERFIAVALTTNGPDQAGDVINSMVKAFGLPADRKPEWNFGQTNVKFHHLSVVIRGVPMKK